MGVTSKAGVEEWTERARSLAPVVAQYADESEQARRMAPAMFEAFKASGIFDMLCPTAFGGPQASVEAYIRVLEEISRQDGSAGWNLLIWIAQGLLADYMPEDVARAVVGAGKGNLVAGSLNPTGQAIPVAEGYKITGRWSFASGCEYATTLIAACMVIADGAPRFLADGVPDIQVCIIPQSACQIIDTWHTAGMRGTGSQDFAVQDLFVASDHAVPLGPFVTGPSRRPSTACPTPLFDLGANMAAVALGIARDAIDSFKTLAAGKIPTIGTTTLANHPIVHQQLGQAEALVRSARAYVYETLREVTTRQLSGAPVTDEDSANMRLCGAYATQCAVDATDLMFDAAGGSSVYASSRLERCWRNVHMVTHHLNASPTNIEMSGQFFLGGPLMLRR